MAGKSVIMPGVRVGGASNSDFILPLGGSIPSAPCRLPSSQGEVRLGFYCSDLCDLDAIFIHRCGAIRQGMGGPFTEMGPRCTVNG